MRRNSGSKKVFWERISQKSAEANAQLWQFYDGTVDDPCDCSAQQSMSSMSCTCGAIPPTNTRGV